MRILSASLQAHHSTIPKPNNPSENTRDQFLCFPDSLPNLKWKQSRTQENAASSMGKILKTGDLGFSTSGISG